MVRIDIETNPDNADAQSFVLFSLFLIVSRQVVQSIQLFDYLCFGQILIYLYVLKVQNILEQFFRHLTSFAGILPSAIEEAESTLFDLFFGPLLQIGFDLRISILIFPCELVLFQVIFELVIVFLVSLVSQFVDLSVHKDDSGRMFHNVPLEL